MAKSKSSKQSAEKSSDKNSLVIYRRILRLDQLFSSGTYPSLSELIEDNELDASRTTIFRTIDFMKIELHAPIVFDKVHGGYCYSEKTFRLPSVFTSEQEIFALTLMQDMTSILKGTPLYDSANSILSLMRKSAVFNPNDWKKSKDSNDLDDTQTDWIENRYIFLNKNGDAVDNDTWKVLHDAMKLNRQVEFEYHDEQEGKWIKTNLFPYQAVNSDGRWYVWGLVVSKNSEKLFDLNLIRNIKIFPRAFTLPDDFDLRNRTTGAFGAYVGDEEYLFKAKFYGHAASYVKRISWAKDQKTEGIENDGVLLSFTGTELEPFLELILSFGKDAIPLAPKELVDMWKKEVSYSATTNKEKVEVYVGRTLRHLIVRMASCIDAVDKAVSAGELSKEDGEKEKSEIMHYCLEQFDNQKSFEKEVKNFKEKTGRTKI